MSKPVKNLIAESYTRTFADVSSALLIDIRGIKSNDNNTLRGSLKQNEVRVTVVRNSLAKRALAGTDLAKLTELFDGPSALVYRQGDSVVEIARQVLQIAKDIPALQVKGAIMDGQVFAADQVEALSKYPTRIEAQAQAVQIILTPGQKLVGAILGPGRKIASLVKAIEEKLEKGEEIAKVG